MEQVLAVSREVLDALLELAPRGLISDGVVELPRIIQCHGTFLDRASAETDPTFKQIIPYACVRHGTRYFLLRRKRAQGEQRLHDKLSIGVGGHINPSEKDDGQDIINVGLRRELNEELEIGADYSPRLIGMINDDTTDVGRVHLGVLFEIESSTSSVTVREHEKMSGSWVDSAELRRCFANLETWSQIVCEEYLFS